MFCSVVEQHLAEIWRLLPFYTKRYLFLTPIKQALVLFHNCYSMVRENLEFFGIFALYELYQRLKQCADRVQTRRQCIFYFSCAKISPTRVLCKRFCAISLRAVCYKCCAKLTYCIDIARVWSFSCKD